MAGFIWSRDPLAMHKMRYEDAPAPLSAAELARLGIPARKIPRVQAELGRLAAQTDLAPGLLPALAKQIARQLV